MKEAKLYCPDCGKATIHNTHARCIVCFRKQEKMIVHNDIEISRDYVFDERGSHFEYRYHPGFNDGTYHITPELSKRVFQEIGIYPEEQFPNVEVYEE